MASHLMVPLKHLKLRMASSGNTLQGHHQGTAAIALRFSAGTLLSELCDFCGCPIAGRAQGCGLGMLGLLVRAVGGDW